MTDSVRRETTERTSGGTRAAQLTENRVGTEAPSADLQRHFSFSKSVFATAVSSVQGRRARVRGRLGGTVARVVGTVSGIEAVTDMR